MRLKEITKHWTERQDACEKSVERFFKIFPDGLDLKDEKQVKRAWRQTNKYDLTWFLRELGVIDRGHYFCDCGEPGFCGLETITKRELRSYAKEAGLPL